MGRKRKPKSISKPRHSLLAKEFVVTIIRRAMKSSFESVAEDEHFPPESLGVIFRRAAHKLKTNPKWRYKLKGHAMGIDDAHPKRREEPGDKKPWTLFTDLVPGYPIAEIIGEANSAGVVAAFDLIPGSEFVDTIVTDGSFAYNKAIEMLGERGREILHIIDKFHVIRKFSFALEKTVTSAAADKSNKETRELLLYFKTRLTKRPDELISPSDQMLHCIAEINPHVKLARELYLKIHEFYDCEHVKGAIPFDEAEKVLAELKKLHKDAPHQVKKHFVKAASYINTYKWEILNFFLSGLTKFTNGPAEMNNRRFKKVKRFSQRCGFETIAVRVMYDSGVWKHGPAIQGVAEGFAVPLAPPRLLRAARRKP